MHCHLRQSAALALSLISDLELFCFYRCRLSKVVVIIMIIMIIIIIITIIIIIVSKPLGTDNTGERSVDESLQNRKSEVKWT